MQCKCESNQPHKFNPMYFISGLKLPWAGLEKKPENKNNSDHHPPLLMREVCIQKEMLF